MIFLVMYHLKPPSNSSAVYEVVSTFGPASHVLDSFCLVATEKTLAELRDALKAKLNGQESIFVTPLTQMHADYLPKPALEWIAAQRDGKPKHKAAAAAGPLPM